MGLTKRQDGYYVEFSVLDNGKVLTLARNVPGAKLKRWRVGCRNKEIAQNQESKIKTDLMMGKILSKQTQSVSMTFAYWAKEYMEIEEVKKLRSCIEAIDTRAEELDKSSD